MRSHEKEKKVSLNFWTFARRFWFSQGEKERRISCSYAKCVWWWSEIRAEKSILAARLCVGLRHRRIFHDSDDALVGGFEAGKSHESPSERWKICLEASSARSYCSDSYKRDKRANIWSSTKRVLSTDSASAFNERKCFQCSKISRTTVSTEQKIKK